MIHDYASSSNVLSWRILCEKYYYFEDGSVWSTNDSVLPSHRRRQQETQR